VRKAEYVDAAGIFRAFFKNTRLTPVRMKSLSSPGPRLLATRNSLIERLGNWEDRARWQEFFDTYWRLIYGVARKSGLSDAEAQDVVQDTVISVAKNITRYDKKAGSFKSWLLQLTRWRIIDQVRKRSPAGATRGGADTGRTATIDRVPDTTGKKLEEIWEEEISSGHATVRVRTVTPPGVRPPARAAARTQNSTHSRYWICLASPRRL